MTYSPVSWIREPFSPALFAWKEKLKGQPRRPGLTGFNLNALQRIDLTLGNCESRKDLPATRLKFLKLTLKHIPL